MKTMIQPGNYDSLIPHASPSTRRLALRLAAFGRWLALALVAGFSLAAQAQTTATATAIVSYGFVVAYTVTAGGSGYTEPPVVTVLGGSGSGATATALVTNGVVTQINVVSPGNGYTSPPEVVISAAVVEPMVLALQMIPLVTIHGLPGDTNQIERASSLGGGRVWVPLATVVLTNAVQEWYDRISPPGSQGSYRSVLVGAGSRPSPGLRFVWLPAGQFLMGSPTNEVDHQGNEGPQTRVTLTRGFYLGRCEVTQGEYLSVIGTNPSYCTGDTNRPVETVCWYDVTNYCAQLTARERLAGRLPAGWV